MSTNEEKEQLRAKLQLFTDLTDRKKFLNAELKAVNAAIKAESTPLVQYLLETERDGFMVAAPIPEEGEDIPTDSDGAPLKSEIKLKKGPTPKISISKKHVEERMYQYLNQVISAELITVTTDPALIAKEATGHIYSNLEKADVEPTYSLNKIDPKPPVKRRKLSDLDDETK